MPDRLGIDDVAMLAVRNNPDLAAARTQMGVAQAQAVEAGLLPNPSLSADYGFFLGGAGFINSIAAGLSEDIKALVVLSAKRRGAEEVSQQINASLLWQEWQIIGKARLLAIDCIEGEKARLLLLPALQLLTERVDRDQAALARNDATLIAIAPDLTALADLRRQAADLDRLQSTRRHDLNALLGLEPDATLPLVSDADITPINPDDAAESLAVLSQRRPDLIALQLGYNAEEEKLRAAILSQFPALVLGANGGRDTSDARTIGPQINMDLPIFNRNQGNIAIEHATREQLHEEYAARLNAATGEAAALLDDTALIERQLRSARVEVADIAKAADHAANAYRGGALDERSYIDLTTAKLAKQQEILAMEQSLLEQQIALSTLLGIKMPKITLLLEVSR